MSDLFEKLKGNILHGYTYSVSQTVEQISNNRIEGITIHRVPLEKASILMLNLISIGDFNKRLAKSDHDKLFHLYMIIELEDGLKYIVEKNSVINIKRVNDNIPSDEQINIPVRTMITVGDMLLRTINFMGKDKYFRYSGANNNCQIYLDSILSANNLNSNDAKQFILQDTKSLFENNVKFRKILNTITDISAGVNRLAPYVAPLLQPMGFFYNLNTYLKQQRTLEQFKIAQ